MIPRRTGVCTSFVLIVSVQHTDQTVQVCLDGLPAQEGKDDQPGRRPGQHQQPLGRTRRQDRECSSCLTSFLLAVALVRADCSFLLTAVLPVAPAVLAPVHPMRVLTVSALALTASLGVAAAQVFPEGRVYMFHSRAQGSCPALDWHVVIGPNNTLNGIIAWDDMKAIAHATGSLDPTARTFSMQVHEVGGQGHLPPLMAPCGRTAGWWATSRGRCCLHGHHRPVVRPDYWRQLIGLH